MDLREITEFFKDFAGYIITALIIIIVFTFIIALHPVAGNSMSPTLEEGQIVLVSKISYKLFDPQRNEIVILKNNSKSYVKRIIGLPGERIDYLNGVLYVNNVAYKETFLKDDVVTSNFLFEDICSSKDCVDGVIPDRMYLVLGDNRPESVDSRTSSFGLVKKKDIKGKVFFKVWPVSSFGSVY